MHIYIVGAKNLIVEVDAKYIKGMLNEPELQPNTVINRWIQGVLLFDFTLIHVPELNSKDLMHCLDALKKMILMWNHMMTAC